jgi:Cysteine-rich secretory protein family
MKPIFKTRVTLIASLLILIAAIAGSVRAQAPRGSAEQILFDAANRDRQARRLRPFRWDNSLANGARHHAQRMAQQNTLSHQLPGEEDFKARALRAGARFSSLAENIAEGPDAPGIHTQWMNSPPHRENLLDAKLDSIGIAVAERNGEMFAVEDFSLAVADLSLEEQELQVAAVLTDKNLNVMNDVRGKGITDARAMVNEARNACAQTGNYAGTQRSSLVVRYTTADLSHLPDSLTKQLRKNEFHSAAIGACRSFEKSEFSNYRLAILLFD